MFFFFLIVVLQSIIETIKADWMSGIKTTWEHETMVKYAAKGRVFAISSYVSFIEVVGSFIFLPLFDLNVRTINNSTDIYEDRILPLQTSYPFDYDWSPMFELMYATHVVAGVLAFASMCTPDVFFGALVVHASACCEILERKTKEMLSYEKVVVAFDPERFEANVKEVVDKHVRLIG